jgi:hypothetical protein
MTLKPKGDKDCSLLKTWRPISLLSVSYKMLTPAGQISFITICQTDENVVNVAITFL